LTIGKRFLGAGLTPGERPFPFPAGLGERAGEPNCTKYSKATRCTWPGVRFIEWVRPLLPGFLLGYLAYDLIHYVTHHFPMRKGRILRFLKRHHMLHHYKTPDQRFGVSSPFWDWVYGTWPKE
jgi:sterol desaturase/sphingolipid hydroxylase (fatty acid hydroxylase superfamily)